MHSPPAFWFAIFFSVIANNWRCVALLSNKPAPELCTDSATITENEIVLSPVARRGATVLTVDKPAVFKETQVEYSVFQHPVTELSEAEQLEHITVFEFKDNVLRVGTEKLYALLNLNEQYELPLPLVIEAKSGGQSCLLNYTLRFSDPLLAVEPDWEVNPILTPSYEFNVDCPAPRQVAGKIGDEQRNEIYNVTYTLEKQLETKINGAKTTFSRQQLIWLNDQTGELSTRKTAPPINSSFWLKVSASAIRQRKIYSFVTVKYGTCDGEKRAKHDQKFHLQFSLRCGRQGDIVGKLPDEIDGSRIESYVMFPGVKEFSLTVDGKMRVLADALDPRTYKNIRINAQTEAGNGHIYYVNVAVLPCMEDAPGKTSTILGVAEVYCPQINSLIIDLSRLQKFQQALKSNSLSEPVLSTNMPSTVQVTAAKSLVWARKPSSLTDDDTPLQITVFAQSNTAGLVALGSVKVTIRQQAAECDQIAKHAQHSQKSLLVRCASPGLAIAFIAPNSLPKSNTTDISRSSSESARFSLCCSQYYEIGKLSGVISITRVPPPELTSMLSVQVNLPASPENPEGFTIVGVFYLFTDSDTSSCSTYDENTDLPSTLLTSNDVNEVKLSLVCQQFNDSTLRREATVGVVSLNKPGSFVGQVSVSEGSPSGMRAVRNLCSQVKSTALAYIFTQAYWDKPFSTNAPIKWSLGKSSIDSGYRIESSTGYIYTTKAKPADLVTVEASAKNGMPCSISMRPVRINSANDFNIGLINHQPPHLTTGGPNAIKTRSLPCVLFQPETGPSLALLDSGTLIVPITAEDADIGKAGNIYYSLCSNDRDTKCTSLEATLHPTDFASTTVKLTIDPQTGFLFAASNARVTANVLPDEEPKIKIRVKVSNDPSVLGDARAASRKNRLIGLPADAADIETVSIKLVCARNNSNADDS